MTAIAEQVSYRHFVRVYWEDFAAQLKFRGERQHKVCSTCLKHKLIIRYLSHNTAARLEQAKHYHRHLRRQYADRRVYWQDRADARTMCTVNRSDANLVVVTKIVVIMDGVDQAKFAWPRCGVMKSADLDGMIRPRLHIDGVIVHNIMVFFTVSEANMKKYSNFSIELLAFVYSKLVNMGVRMEHAEVFVQVDNTSRENKNNHLMRFYAFLVASRKVLAATNSYLESGHTHEDIDQVHGQICEEIKKHRTLQTPKDFEKCLDNFLKHKVVRPCEKLRFAIKVDRVRDWATWLQLLQVHLRGIGGPSAPHRFRFERQSGIYI